MEDLTTMIASLSTLVTLQCTPNSAIMGTRTHGDKVEMSVSTIDVKEVHEIKDFIVVRYPLFDFTVEVHEEWVFLMITLKQNQNEVPEKPSLNGARRS